MVGVFFKRQDRHFRGMRTNNKSSLFSKNNKNKEVHPNYIVGDDGSNYYSFGLTSEKKKGKGHNNHLLSHNPNGSDNPSYLRKQMNVDSHSNYSSEIYQDLHMSSEDDDYVDSLIKKYGNFKSKIKK